MALKSILQEEKECLFCHTTRFLEEHHVFFGTANRKKSEKYGLKVWLCRSHHTAGDQAVHRNRMRDLELKLWAQQKAEEHYGWTTEQFIQEFGRNYK